MRRSLRLLAVVALLLAAPAADARSWAWLGVRIRDMSEQEMEEVSARHGIREGFGVVIVEVIEGTPAARAGIKSGDIVVAFGERPVTETRMLQRLISAAPTEVDTRLTVLRREGRRQLDVRLTNMPLDVTGDRVAAEFGFVLRDVEAQPGVGSGRPAGAPPAIGFVLRGGEAEKAGLVAGDVLLQIGERAVLTREAAREALAEIPLERPLRLTVRRGESRLSLTLSPPPSAR